MLLPILVAVAAYGGWEFWKDFQNKRAQQGSDQYTLILDALEPQGTEGPSAEQISKARDAAEQMTEDFSGTMYADMSQLIIARLDLDAGDTEAAKASLQEVVDGGVHTASVSLAKARLAKIKILSQDYDAALALVATPSEEAFKSLYAEIRGDIMVAKGDTAAAATAYEEALVNLLPRQASRRSLINLKIEGTKSTATVSEQTLSQAKVSEASEKIVNVEAEKESAATEENP